jgi:hypothetical protein
MTSSSPSCLISWAVRSGTLCSDSPSEADEPSWVVWEVAKPDFRPKAALKVLGGLLVGRPVVELVLDVVAQHLHPSPAVHGVELRKRLHRDPEGNPPPHNGRGVVCEAWDGSSAGLIDQ